MIRLERGTQVLDLGVHFDDADCCTGMQYRTTYIGELYVSISAPDLCDVFVSNLCFSSHLFSHVFS